MWDRESLGINSFKGETAYVATQKQETGLRNIIHSGIQFQKVFSGLPTF